MNVTDSLDSEELFRLALLDVQASRHDGAIDKLKRAAALAPSDARLHFLLAAEHAEIGLFDRAKDGMRRALDLDGSLHTARFQLGLLHYSLGEFDQAEGAWGGLDDLDRDDPLYLFKSALIEIRASAWAEAIDLLERAQQRATSNPALAGDIAKVLANARQKLAEAATESSAPKTAPSAAGLLERYGDSWGSTQ